MSRRGFIGRSAGIAGAGILGLKAAPALAAAPALTVSSRTIEVAKKAAKVFGVVGAGGKPGVIATQGDRFLLAVLNDTPLPLQMHWHGQTKAPASQDRSRPDGGTLAAGQTDVHDFELTSGTHWMHSHTLTEQQLLAAPMIAREKDAGDVQDVIVMLHDFAFRAPEEILAELGGKNTHTQHSATPQHNMHQGHNMPRSMPSHAGHMMGMQHANDVRYDAFLANDRTLDDPEAVKVEKGGRVRLRIINGGTATAFFISVPGLRHRCIAVDGSACAPLASESYPLAQGQRLDLQVDIPAGGGAFPVFAQVEDAAERTGIILATAGASIAKIAPATTKAALAGVELDALLRARDPLSVKAAEKSFMVMLGEEPNYRWTINGRAHGEHTPFDVKQGERIEMTFMNPTSMMHPMHLHGHHFQVVGIGGRRYPGPMRDTVIVPTHNPITIAFDANLKGSWFLHCHHLYHMATGMMTEVKVS